MKAGKSDVQIGKVIGENEDGITLFVPKDLQGTFTLSEGDTFLSILFVQPDGHGNARAWIPWAEGPVLS